MFLTLFSGKRNRSLSEFPWNTDNKIKQEQKLQKLSIAVKQLANTESKSDK